ncbi:glycoside hydrolase family 16 protein [Nocardioides sp.]|jgi:beta-glucanase (GH16 family)|uniref:glycoside hydrolase family 16 protein n=1 Tax=Nocardioides sp. TaxID=35761 RepID=UPI0031FE7F75|nr:hypothetical protein [Nocardioides sp.]
MGTRNSSRAASWPIRWPSLGLLAAGLLLLSLAQPSPQLKPQSSPFGAADACGTPIAKASGGFWTCTFADEFDGTSLNRAKWSVLTTAREGIRHGPECYLDSPDNVAVRDGSLVLTARDSGTARHCHPGVFGDPVTPYTSGEVSTLGKFSQAYGRVEIRAAFPDVHVPGLHSALWMWPDQQSYGPWPASGEIDIGEFYTAYPDRVIPYLHHANIPGDPTVTNNFCMVADPSAFHDYTLVWAPGHIIVAIDGQTCVDHLVRSTVPPSTRAPFDKPFFINLTQALGMAGRNGFSAATTPLPASLTVDYVRVWS